MFGKQFKRLSKLANRGGWIFSDAHFLAVDVELAPASSRILPLPLRLAKSRSATLFVAHYPKTSFGSVYSEAGLFVEVRSGLSQATHCPWMLVDDDVALIAGRDLLGYPKKMGTIEIDFDLSGGQTTARVERRGIELFRMSARIGEPLADPPPMLGRRFRNVAGAIGLGFQRLLAFTPSEEILEVRGAEVDVEFGPSSNRDPIRELIAGSRGGRFYRVNIGARLSPFIGGGSLPIPVAPVSPMFWLRNLAMRHQ